MREFTLPLSDEQILSLNEGEIIRVSGDIYTARDAAHKRIVEAIKNGEKPPFPLEGAAIYYCGPTPARKGELIGSCGPTTSARMDDYTPFLLERGLKVTIGKGDRSQEVTDAIKKYGCVYLVAVGGAAALMKNYVTAAIPVAYPDLGCEAITRLTVKDMELYVHTSCKGKRLAAAGRCNE